MKKNKKIIKQNKKEEGPSYKDICKVIKNAFKNSNKDQPKQTKVKIKKTTKKKEVDVDSD